MTVSEGAGKATTLDADKLDGKDSTEFATKASEAWHEVGKTGEPKFQTGGGGRFTWANFDAGHNPAGFYKDSTGAVHIKGMVRFLTNATGGSQVSCFSDAVFILPQGYRPSVREVLISVSNNAPVRVNIDSSGRVYPCDGGKFWNCNDWLSLDGISFRAAN